jgi:hypothetical protein
LCSIEPLIAFPEHKVPLPGGRRDSQNDIFVLGKSDEGLVSITVEGKVAESFGPTLGEWTRNMSPGKRERLDSLKAILGLEEEIDSSIRYQLLHRTASAVIEANRFNAKTAVMLVHPFSQAEDWFEDYQAFVRLYDKDIGIGQLTFLTKVGGVEIFTGWVKGEASFLDS